MVHYRIFSQSASITIDGQNFPIHAGHPQYQEIIALAKANKGAELLSLLQHEEFKPLGLELQEGVLFYKKIALPHFFYNRIKEASKKEEVMPYVNAWFNLEKRLSLLDQKRFGVYIKDRLLLWDKTAAEFIYHNTESVFSDKAFYNIPDSNVFESILKNHSTVASYIKSFWPQANESLLGVFKEICLSEGNLNLSLIRRGEAFQSFSPEELENLFKANLKRFKHRTNYSNCSHLTAKLTKTQIQKHFWELLTDQKLSSDFSTLLENCPTYEIRDFKNVEELKEQIGNELKKYDPNAYHLKISENHPLLWKLNGEVCGTGLKLVVPSRNPELIEWGRELSHCIGGYGKRVASGQSFCFAIYTTDDKLLYTLEIQGKRLCQFMGKHNSPVSRLNAEHYKQVVDFLVKENIVDKKIGLYA